MTRSDDYEKAIAAIVAAKEKEEKELKQQHEMRMTDDEYAAIAAFEAIAAETGRTSKDIGVDEMHDFLSRFGLMSREALKDELKMTNPMPISPMMSPEVSRRAGSSTMASAAVSVVGAAVAKSDFVDFLMSSTAAGNNSNSSNNAKKRRNSQHETTTAAWIDRAIGGGGGNKARGAGAGSSSSPHGGLPSSAGQHLVSILDPIAATPLSHQHDTSNISNNINSFDYNGGGGSGGHHDLRRSGSSSAALAMAQSGVLGQSAHLQQQTAYGQCMNESLASIEMRLRQALDARASTPVPMQMLTDHEKHAAAAAAASAGGAGAVAGGGTSPSVFNKGRPGRGRSNTPIGDRRRQVGGVTNALYSPTGGMFKTRGASPATMNATQQQGGGGVEKEATSSPSAVLRRHQQQQLEALLALRRSGGNILQQRQGLVGAGGAGALGTPGQGRKTPSRMAGFSVVTKK